jgi:cell division protein FtsL
MQDLILADMASLGIRDSQVLLICLIAAAAILVVIVRDYFRQLTAEAEAAAETDADADFEAEVLAFDEVENDPAEERPFRQIVPQPMSASQQFGRRRAA